MKRRASAAGLALIMVATLLTGGCITRAPNAALEDARTAYQKAERDPLVVSKASRALQDAQESLRLTEDLWKRREAQAIVDHYAYLTKQSVAIARESANVKTAEAQVAQMREQQQKLLLELRTRQAEVARQQAEMSATQAENARRQARAQARAAELARAEAQRQRREAEMARLQAAERKREAELAQLQANTAQTRAAELAAGQLTGLQARQTERGLVLTLADALFDSGKAELKAGAERTIDRLTVFLKEYRERNILIEAFTDDIGTDAYNKNLSQERAYSVREALVRQGVDPERIKARGYGEGYPVASNDTAAGRRQNRRIEVVVSDKLGKIPERTN